jgi:alpha-galactosidase
MTNEEYRAHFSLWAIMAAPLIAGNDLRSIVGESRQARAIREILTNAEVIAVDQDSLGVQGLLVASSPPELQVWSKPLADGSRAVVLFNRAPVPTTMSVSWNRIGIATDTALVRDLWAHEDVGRVVRRHSAMVPSHGVVMLRVTPVMAS